MNNPVEQAGLSPEYHIKPDWDESARNFVAHVDLRPDGKRTFHAIFVDPDDQKAVLDRIRAAQQSLGSDRRLSAIVPESVDQVFDIALPDETTTPTLPAPHSLEAYIAGEPPSATGVAPRQWSNEENVLILLPPDVSSSDTQRASYAQLFAGLNRYRDRVCYGDGPMITIVAPLASRDDLLFQADLASTSFHTVFP